MGNAMAQHLLKIPETSQLTVFNRTKQKTAELEALGARVVDSPADVARASDIVFTCVGFPEDLLNVMHDAERGVLPHLTSSSVVCDMTTGKPSVAQELAEATSAFGSVSLDAPVSGGDVGAKNGTLSIMVGGDSGDASLRDAMAPYFAAMGENVTYCGDGAAGAGQHTKMVNQILIASNMIGVVEGLLYAEAAGLSLETTINAVSAGAAGSWSLSNLAPRIVRGDFAPGFLVDHFIKDLGIALAEANAMGLALPGLALAKQLYMAVHAQGHGARGTHALALALRHLNGKQAEEI
jgi:3-hydroxyisobutyrate dehydrogenase